MKSLPSAQVSSTSRSAFDRPYFEIANCDLKQCKERSPPLAVRNFAALSHREEEPSGGAVTRPPPAPGQIKGFFSDVRRGLKSQCRPMHHNDGTGRLHRAPQRTFCVEIRQCLRGSPLRSEERGEFFRRYLNRWPRLCKARKQCPWLILSRPPIHGFEHGRGVFKRDVFT
jgi:hypothetical protein